MEAAAFFRLPKKWAFPRRFCILTSSQLFCIGVIRRSSCAGLFFSSPLSIPYIWCLGRALFSSSRKRRLSHRYDKKSLNGSRVHEFIKEKEYRHIDRLVDGGAGLVFSIFFGATWGQTFPVLGVGWQRHCVAVFVAESQLSPGLPDRFWEGAGGCGVGS
ncbi:hypothetical protein VTI74DRAFT_3262 [Chaetomium olivicolor]